ncbi:MAG: phosphoenolpyruvate--protein phosphotransferase [Phycisphaerales bacterium]|nr:MAG: phosphoenolpyruvate--protein phosphotransferase [Phycisphaerales bacterium]
MQTKTGVPASPGIAIAPAIILDSEEYPIPERHIDRALVPTEIDRINRAFDSAIGELTELEAQQHDLGQIGIRDLFAVHRHFLQDKSLRTKIINLVNAEAMTAECAIDRAFGDVHQQFAKANDRYVRERAADIADVKKRLLKYAIGIKESSLDTLGQEVIIVAKDLRPTQAALLDPRFVKGIACDAGGKTSHTSIVARALGIPTVVALGDLTGSVARGTQLIVDGNTGIVIIDPTSDTLAEFRAAAESIATLQQDLQIIRHEPAVTRDQMPVTLLANIEFPEEIEHVLQVGAEGVGLFRTEFLYLQAGVEPSEEVHYTTYARVIQAMQGRPVTIRTMDLGADKFTQSHRFTPEANPFLGLRSIRFSLKHRDMFVAQLRAILRASALGPVKIMFPMITTPKELTLAHEVLAYAQSDLRAGGIPFAPDVPVGIMIETPAAALMSHRLARCAAFFSIGSNDLTQYTLAVDRGNPQVADLFSAAEPAVLELIKTTVDGAKTAGIEVSLCGEMAAEPKYTMLLLGLGLRTLSLIPQMIPEIKKIIRSVTVAECERVADAALAADSAEQVLESLVMRTRPLLPQFFK